MKDFGIKFWCPCYFGICLSIHLFIQIMFPINAAASSTITNSRNDVCKEIIDRFRNSPYQIKILKNDDGTHYFESAYYYASVAFRNAAFSPSFIEVILPPGQQNQLCCGDGINSCSNSCSGKFSIQPAGNGNSYIISFTKNLTTNLDRYGVRYHSFQLYYYESATYNFRKPNPTRQTQNNPTTGVTVALYDCPDSGLSFVKSSDTVSIRRLAFLESETSIRIYDPKSQLNGVKPNDAFFELNEPDRNGIFQLNPADDFLYMNPSKVPLGVNDAVFDLTITLHLGDNTETSMKLTVIALAENRYNPTFVIGTNMQDGCIDPRDPIFVSSEFRPPVNCSVNAACRLADLRTDDTDGDDVYFDSFEINHPEDAGIISLLKSYFVVEPTSTDHFTLYQKLPLTRDILEKWSNVAADKGFIILSVKIRDRSKETDPKVKYGKCTIRLNLPTLDLVSKAPKFIAPLPNLRISIVDPSDRSVPILQALAVDWIRHKLEISDEDVPIKYSLEEMNINGNVRGSFPFTIDDSGKIRVNNTLKPSHSYEVKIIASFAPPKRYYRNYAFAAQSSEGVIIKIYILESTASRRQLSPRLELLRPNPAVTDNPRAKTVDLATVVARFDSDTKLEENDVRCVALDKLEKAELSWRVFNNEITIKLTSNSPTVWLDYSENRKLHIRVDISREVESMYSQFGLVVRVQDDNQNSPHDFTVSDLAIPDDVKKNSLIATVKLFDADLLANGGISCRARVSCLSTLGGEDKKLRVQFESSLAQSQGSAYVYVDEEFEPGSSGKCSIIVEDTKWSGNQCDKAADTDIGLRVQQIAIDMQPRKASDLSLYCPDGIPQSSQINKPVSTRCRLGPFKPNDSPTASSDLPNHYFFASDPTGTFASVSDTGVIKLLQPIILSNDTFASMFEFPIQIAVFNGRFWTNSSGIVKVQNNYLSKPKLSDVFVFNPTAVNNYEENVANEQVLRMPIGQTVDASSILFTMTLSPTAKTIITPYYRRPRATNSVRIRASSIESDQLKPYLFGPSAKNYILSEDSNSADIWYLRYNFANRAVTETSLIGEQVSIAAHYQTIQAAAEGTDETVTVGNTVQVIFVPQTGGEGTYASLEWYWILVIVFAAVFLLILMLLTLFVLTKRRKQKKVGTPEPGTPVKYVSGYMPSIYSPAPMQPNQGPYPDSFTLDEMLSQRLRKANMDLTSPSLRPHDGGIMSSDDGLDAITVSSGYNDDPLNLQVLNQLGQEYSNLAETCGVAQRV